jgi:hypothetical protein
LTTKHFASIIRMMYFSTYTAIASFLGKMPILDADNFMNEPHLKTVT